MSFVRDSASSTIDMTPEERREQQKKEEALHASSLRIPRRYDLFCYLNFGLLSFICVGFNAKLFLSRPPWNAKMSVEELDDNEKRAFLEWRRNLARSAFVR